MEINDEEVEPITIEPLSEANDFGFEPQARLRANTWPVRPRECATPEEASSSTPPVPETPENVLDEYDESPLKDSGSGLVKKAGTRRNAWGSLSYADLITKAIESTADKRLTLSQIYDWMVQNVPYFKDKGDNNSSAGWKNSIRHNLSLHNRFMRVQNEGTGKSSWWMINPDAKPGKTPRRRAASMDPEEMAKKRGRAKKRVEQLRSGDFESYRHNSNPGSEYNSNSDLSSIGGDPFTINSLDIRARTGSNASSFGRLSPIQAGMEPELDDDFGPSWANGKDFMIAGRRMTSGAESVSEHLAELLMSDPFANADIKPSVENHLSGSFMHNPPAYPNHSSAMGMQLQPRNSFGVVRSDGMGTISNAAQPPLLANEFGYPNKAAVSRVSLRDLLSDNVSAAAQHQADYSADLKYLQSGIPPNQNVPSSKELGGVTSPGSKFVSPPVIHISPQHQQAMMVRGVANFSINPQQQQLLQLGGGNTQAMQQRLSNDILLQTVQMRGMQQQQQMLRSPSHIKQESGFPTSPIIAKSEPVSPVSCLPHSPANNHLNHLPGSRYSGSDLTTFVKPEQPVLAAGGHYAVQGVAARHQPPPPLPMDLDFSLQELRAGGLECDMDRILQEGNFDLEFQPGISGTYPYS